jgi:hypothetical protein
MPADGGDLGGARPGPSAGSKPARRFPESAGVRWLSAKKQTAPEGASELGDSSL